MPLSSRILENQPWVTSNGWGGGGGSFVVIFTPPFSWDVLTFVGFAQRRAAFLAERPFPFLITTITQTVHLRGCENFLTGFI